MKYFAYGSNMCTTRLRARVPSASFICTGTLTGHSLRFHKRSRDGSGKADAFETGNADDRVIGVVFDIDKAEKPKLDGAEGLGKGYIQKLVQVITDTGAVLPAFTYIAESSAIDESLKPYSWYKDFVIQGAKGYELPADYIASIEAVADLPDLDQEREDNQRKLLPCD